MESLYLLIPLSVLVVFGAIALFWWMSGNGQFDDMEGPARRILFDEEEAAAVAPPAPVKRL